MGRIVKPRQTATQQPATQQEGAALAGTLEHFQRVARALHVLRIPGLVLAVCSAAVFLLGVFDSALTAGKDVTLPAFIGLLWGLSTFVFTDTFQSLPPRLPPHAPFAIRVRRHLSRFGYWILALMMIAASIAVLVLSSRFLSIWSSAN